jgi:hypothetical protein
LNNAPLPNRIYVGFVHQANIYGLITNISTFFDCLNLRTMEFKLNGRDLLVEPVAVTYAKANTGEINIPESDGRQGYLSLLEILNQISDGTTMTRIGYHSYMRGYTLYGVELGKCGEKTGGIGTLDIEATFNDQLTDMPACMLVFTEKTASVQIA